MEDQKKFGVGIWRQLSPEANKQVMDMWNERMKISLEERIIDIMKASTWKGNRYNVSEKVMNPKLAEIEIPEG